MGEKDSARDDFDLFRKEMAGVTRRDYASDRRQPDPPPKPAPTLKHRPAGATDAATAGVLVDQTAARQDGAVVFARGGVQRGVLRKLKRGDYRATATLDLHGSTAAEAEARLHRFITHARATGHTTLCIIHGKGLRSGAGGGVLKPVTLNWLKREPAVKAFCSATPQDGGGGAVYVLLNQRRARA